MEKTDKKNVLSLNDWHKLAENGVRIPMRVPINGVSMMPLIRRNRDYVTIHPVDRVLKRGDIVLFYDPHRQDQHQYVLHRVWRIENGMVETWGDNCPRPDARMTEKNVWGIAEKVERGKITIEFESDPARHFGIALAHSRHIHRRVLPFFIRIAVKITPKGLRKALKKLRPGWAPY